MPQTAAATATLSEEQLIARAREITRRAAWDIGECAAIWTVRFSAGRTDADFARLIDMDAEPLRQRRVVWQAFGDSPLRTKYPKLNWSHFREVLNWDDADEMLNWAGGLDATVAEMRAWRKAKHGQDLFHIFSPGDPDAATEFDEYAEEQGDDSVTIEGRVITAHEPAEKPRSNQKPPPPDRTRSVDIAMTHVRSALALIHKWGNHGQIQTTRTELEAWCEAHTHSKATGGITTKILVDAWNDVPGVKKVLRLTPSRTRAAKLRVRDSFWAANWMEALKVIAKIPALTGENERGWVCDFDWFIRPNTVTQIMEGKYDNWNSNGRQFKMQTKAEAVKKQNGEAFDKVFGNSSGSIEDVPF